MIDNMLQNKLNDIGYTSCIKIFGVPILPPLITEKRRKELNDDKYRAVEVEKKLRGKRSSIDSGVMTGSYIEQFRNGEAQQKDVGLSRLNRLSIPDLAFNENIQNGSPMTSNYTLDYAVSDSFLKTALEDPEFREFFSSTAEKIFKDNKIENILNFTDGDDSIIPFRENNVFIKESVQSSEVLPLTSSFVQPILSELSYSDSLVQVPAIENYSTLKCSEIEIVNGNGSDKNEAEVEPSTPPSPPRIRRNSYTLERPSSVLLEHMAKEESKKWQTFSDKKDKCKGPGFKTFSGRNHRKQWNKKICTPSSHSKIENHRTKYTLARSNTFTKPGTKVDESNSSLPCSSRTSPLQFHTFTRSVDCINHVDEYKKGIKGNFSVHPEPVNKVSLCQIPFKTNSSCQASDSETFVVKNHDKLQSASIETSPTSPINNASSIAHSKCFITDNYSPPQTEFSDSSSQISVQTQSRYVHKNSVSTESIDNIAISENLNHSKDFDDIASLCSSMSISRYLPNSDVSRPSTAEDLSEASIRQLKMKHENELRKLLEKQREEEEIFSQILSTSRSQSSRTATDLSIEETNSELLCIDKSMDSCSRELFPSDKKSPSKTYVEPQNHYSAREKEAATKITAYVKGYLTRRLLKTEKVQQLIELIKESLMCAFSLQLEPHLKPNDLELHERLAHQMTAALCELQSVVSAPVSARMAIIAADRERLRRPASRPSSTISTATRKSILRRQQSLNSDEKKPQESRARTNSFSVIGNTGSVSSRSYLSSGSSSTVSNSSSRKPWR